MPHRIKHYQGEIWGSSESTCPPIKLADLKLRADNEQNASLAAKERVAATLTGKYFNLHIRNLREVKPD